MAGSAWFSPSTMFLLVEYGNRRLRVAGEGAELRRPEDLVEELDDWALLHRVDGTGRLWSTRPWRSGAGPPARAPQFGSWRRCARLVLRDVEAADLVHLADRGADEEVFSFPGCPAT